MRKASDGKTHPRQHSGGFVFDVFIDTGADNAIFGHGNPILYFWALLWLNYTKINPKLSPIPVDCRLYKRINLSPRLGSGDWTKTVQW
jgi:hypothetical protein